MIRQIPLNLKKKLKKKVLQLNTIKEEVNAVKEVEKIVPEENGAAENIVVIEVVVTIIKDHKRMMMVLLFRQMRNQNLEEEVATVVIEAETEVVKEETKAIEVVSVKVPEEEIAQEKREQLNPLNNSKISNE
jgi:hypothetical protein